MTLKVCRVSFEKYRTLLMFVGLGQIFPTNSKAALFPVGRFIRCSDRCADNNSAGLHPIQRDSATSRPDLMKPTTSQNSEASSSRYEMTFTERHFCSPWACMTVRVYTFNNPKAATNAKSHVFEQKFDVQM